MPRRHGAHAKVGSSMMVNSQADIYIYIYIYIYTYIYILIYNYIYIYLKTIFCIGPLENY